MKVAEEKKKFNSKLTDSCPYLLLAKGTGLENQRHGKLDSSLELLADIRDVICCQITWIPYDLFHLLWNECV